MFLWRISNHATLDGRGGLLASARWHSQGRAIVYLAESPAGALLEALVHLELALEWLPKTYKLLKVEAPDKLPVRPIGRAELAPDWNNDLLATRTLGDEWLRAGSTPLLRVPSAIVPETFNILLNPQHEHAREVRVLWQAEYPWDSRLLK